MKFALTGVLDSVGAFAMAAWRHRERKWNGLGIWSLADDHDHDTYPAAGRLLYACTIKVGRL
jgi:hypothetical protein